MLKFIHSMTTEKFHKILCRGICSYIVLHVAFMYIVQFGILDYFAVNVLQTLYMLGFLFVYIAAAASGQVTVKKQVFFFRRGKEGNRKEGFPYTWFHLADVFLLLLALWGVLSTCFAVDRDIALYGADTRNEGLFAWLAYYLLFYSMTLLSCEEKRKCISYFSGAGLLMLLTGIVFSYTGIGFRISGRAMAFAPLLHHNMYAGFAVLYLGLHLGWAVFGQEKRQRMYAVLKAVTAIAAIICSTSSLGYISAVFMLLVLLCMCILFDRKKGKAFWRSVLLGSLVLILAAAVLVPVIDATNGRLLSQDVESNNQMIEEEGVVNGALNGRMDHWMAGIRALPDYWLFGVGIDNYKKILTDYEGFGRYRVSTAHNEYIQLALTEGVFALIFYLCFLFVIFFAGIRCWKNARPEDWLDRAVFLAFMGYICQAFVNFSSVAVAPFFWMVMGMLSLDKAKESR